MRLRSDKALQATKIEVTLRAGGEVELKGSLASDEQKRRALELADSTQGVEKVTDSLLVAAPNP